MRLRKHRGASGRFGTLASWPGSWGFRTHVAQREDTTALLPLGQPTVSGLPVIFPPQAMLAHVTETGATIWSSTSNGAAAVSGIAIRNVMSCSAIRDSEKQIVVPPGQYFAVSLLTDSELAVAARASSARCFAPCMMAGFSVDSRSG